MLLWSHRYTDDKQELTQNTKYSSEDEKNIFYFNQPGMLLRPTTKGCCANNVFLYLFQDGERCRFFTQEGREGNTQGVPPRKIQAAKGKEFCNFSTIH